MVKEALPRGNNLVLILGVGEDTQQFNVRIRRSDSGKGRRTDYMKSNMVCPSCFLKGETGTLKTRFVCEKDGNIYEKGDIKMKVSDGVVFKEEDLTNFVKVTTPKEIQMKGTISLGNSCEWIPLVIADSYDVFGQGCIQSIWKYLKDENIGLLVHFGYSGFMRRGVIVPSSERLILFELRDSGLLKPPAIEGIGNGLSNETKEIIEFAKSGMGEKLMEFLEHARNNTLGEIEPVQSVEPVAEEKELDISIFKPKVKATA